MSVAAGQSSAQFLGLYGLYQNEMDEGKDVPVQ
jgi:hypothetical protein